MKFETLSQSITENTSYRLNEKGRRFLALYINLIKEVAAILKPVLRPYVNDEEVSSKQASIHILSNINANKEANEKLEAMVRLYVMSNGNPDESISGETFTFNPDDKILEYLEKIEE